MEEKIAKVHDLHKNVHDHNDLVNELKRYFKRNEYILIGIAVAFSLLVLSVLMYLLTIVLR